MNKKGIYLPTLVALTAFLLAYATFAVLTTNTSIAGEAGKNQIDIIQLYQKGEFIRQYIKQSARNSINDALNEFGKNGGLRKEGCKSENEFVWNNECKPNKEDYLLYFDNNFKNYLNLNNKIPKLDFDYTIQENNLIAKSKNSLLFEINKDSITLKEKRVIDFSVKDVGYDHWIKEASQTFNVDENLIRAVINVESNYNPISISNKDAYGLMQIREIAFKDVKNKFNVEWDFEDAKFNPRLNILTGTAYLKLQLDRFKNVDLALAAYNAGPSRVSSLRKIPELKETQNYVKKVNNELNRITGSVVSSDIKRETIVTGTYERDPSFIEKINFNFNILDELHSEVMKSKECLKTKDITFDLSNCIEDKKGFQWNLNREDRFIKFEIITNFKLLKNKNNNLIQENTVLMFKFDPEKE